MSARSWMIVGGSVAAVALSLGGCHRSRSSSSNHTAVVRPSIASVGMISDFEHGPSSGFGERSEWIPIDDRRFGGRSTVKMAVDPAGAHGSGHALHVSGSVLAGDFPFPTGGALVPVGLVTDRIPEPSDISMHKGISFWAKGDGKRYVVKFQEHDIGDFNFHQFVFDSTPAWKQYKVEFAALKQMNWGEQVPWSGKQVSAIMFQNYSAPGEEVGKIDFSLDDVAFF